MRSIQPQLNATAYVLVALGITLPLISIALSQIFLALAIPTFVWERVAYKRSLAPLPPVKLPLLLFMSTTVLALFFSPEPTLGLAPVNKFWLFVIVVLVVNLFDATRIDHAFKLLFVLGVVASLQVIGQFLLVQRLSIETRLTGFMGNWMTLSGELMLVFTASLGYFLFGRPMRAWLWLAGLALIAVALFMTLTRSVWLATVAGTLLLLLMRRPRWETVLAVFITCGVILMAAPELIQRRIASVWDTRDPSNYARLAFWKVGVSMAKANPWTGVGPQRISRVFYDYHRYPEDRYRPGFYPVHMHNNLLQFAAERGIPCALSWLWLMMKLAWDHWRSFRSTLPSLQRTVSAIGLVSIFVLFVAGLFEFNFGDSEVLMIFLFLACAPYAAATTGK